ncbi:MAG: tetratricopeptide repeat protein [Deltaproteobacteria bacterium]|nr:tetratricopeptide repeat protein [Deltaproteobacteria bacterium]
MSHRNHRTVVCAALLGVVLAGCGQHIRQASSSSLTDRLDQMDRENIEAKQQLKKMSTRITELENLVLKQKNEIKKLKVAQATKPKTLVPALVTSALVASAPEEETWEETPVVVAKAPPAPHAEKDEEPRPMLKLYGTTFAPAPAPPTGSGSSVKPAALLMDTSSIGPFVPLTLPAMGGSLPDVDDAVAGKPAEKTPVDPYQQGVVKYQSKEWSNAILYFDIYLKHSPQGSKVMNALFLKAEALYQMKKYLDAIGQFELVLKRYPSGPRAADAKLRIARCYHKLGDKTKAASVYKEIVLQFPQSKQAGKAGKLLQALK